MSTLWLIIWRFQPLHAGHKLLIQTSLRDNSATLVLVWSSNKQDKQNPYDYITRKKIIENEFPNEKIFLWALPDFPDDLQWRDCILSYIPDQVDQLKLYCWDIQNDSAAISLLNLQDSLPFNLLLKEIPRSIIPVSASQVRDWIQEWNTKQLKKYLGEKTLLFLGIAL